MRPWEEFEVSNWPQVLEENRGRRVKAWVQSPAGTHWLRKEPKESRPYELAIEALALRLAEEVGVVAANGSVCAWQVDGSEKRGLVVELFLNRDREQLILGSTCLRREDAAYDPEAKWAHTLPRVRSVLEASGGARLLVAFAQLLAFDAWIGNADRHQENWGDD